MGLLGKMLDALRGRGGADGDAKSNPASDAPTPQSAVTDRLNRIAARGRGAPASIPVAPLPDFVPPPGSPEWDELHAAENAAARDDGEDGEFSSDAQMSPFGEAPTSYEQPSPFDEAPTSYEQPSPFGEEPKSYEQPSPVGDAPAYVPPSIPFATGEREDAGAAPDTRQPFNEAPAYTPEEAPAAEYQAPAEPYPPAPTDEVFAAEESASPFPAEPEEIPVTHGPTVPFAIPTDEAPTEFSTEAEEDEEVEEDDETYRADEASDFPQQPDAFTPAPPIDDYADQRPRIFPGDTPPAFTPPPADEPEEFTPRTPREMEEGLLPLRPAKRLSGLGLSPMGVGDDDEEEEIEEEKIFGEGEDEDEPDDEDEDREEDEEEEEEEEDELDDDFEDRGDAFAAAPARTFARQEPEQDLPAEPGARTAVLFRQYFPPTHDGTLSFFGGAPIASPGFAWPRPEGGAPFSFLMQVDCSEIPARARMGLPDRGTLYFFMDLTWGQQDAFRVIHEDAGGELAEIAPPDDLPAAFGDEAKYVWKWPRGAQELPRLLPKWPFKPVAIDIPADAWGEADEEDEQSALLWPNGEPIGELLIKAQGEELRSDYLTINDFIGPDGSLLRPFDQYPHDARAIQIASSLILTQLERSDAPRAAELEAMSDEDRATLLQSIRDEAQAWYDDASAEPPFSAVPQEFADQFWNWLAGFPWLARFMMTEALTMSIEDSLTAGPEAAASIPPDLASRIRSRHALAVRTDTGLHANTPDRMLAPPVDVQGNQAERAGTHILLLELSSNPGLGHHFGEGVCQFWITPEDMAAGRFDKVELTADAY